MQQIDEMSNSGPPYIGLSRERAAAIENIQQMLNDAEANATEWTIPQLNARTQILEGYWQRFQQAQQQLLLNYYHVEVIAETLHATEQHTLQLYANAKAKLSHSKTVLEAIETPKPRAPRPSEIKVSTFSGKYTEWAAWRSEFKAKVLDAHIDVADKITLLMGALTKEAANCAGRAERLDDVELDRIWSKLDRTYDNRYQQIYAHISKIVNIAPMTQPSADKLRSMIDTVDQHLRMLKRFDLETDHWGPLVCVILLGKLDMDTRNHWESKDALPTAPDLNALFVYLEQRILAIRNIEISVKRTQMSASNTTTSSAKQNKVATEMKSNRFHPYEGKHTAGARQSDEALPSGSRPSAPDCPQCGNNVQHHLWKCDAFRALPLSTKFDQLAKWGICEVCLNSKHKSSECTKGVCPNCKSGRHNSLMCPQAAAKKVNQVRRSRKNSGVTKKE